MMAPNLSRFRFAIAASTALNAVSGFTLQSSASSSVNAFPPSQIRLAYTADASVMSVAWVTSNLTTTGYVPTVQWGSDVPLTSTASGFSDQYTAWNISSPMLHFANMSALIPGAALYYYRVGDAVMGWSEIMTFKSPPNLGVVADSSPLAVAWTGDMGIDYSQVRVSCHHQVAASRCNMQCTFTKQAINASILAGDHGHARLPR